MSIRSKRELKPNQSITQFATITTTTTTMTATIDLLLLHREAAVQARIAQMKVATERAQADPAFQELDERNPGAAIFFAGMCYRFGSAFARTGCVVEGLRARRLLISIIKRCTHTTALTEDGSITHATNAAFDALFQSAEVFAGSILRHKTLSTLLIARSVVSVWSCRLCPGQPHITKMFSDPASTTTPYTSLIDPEDRKCFLEAVAGVFFSAAPQRESMIIKVGRRRGEGWMDAAGPA